MQSSTTFLSTLFFLFSVSSRVSGQYPCPNPNEILPCECSHIKPFQHVIVECSEANSSAQISSAFNEAFWPTTELTDFFLGDDNLVAELPEGVFKNVSFKIIDVENSGVASIHPSVLLASKDELERLNIRFCPMKEFPWDALPQLTRLSIVRLMHNRLTAIPSIRSASLRRLFVTRNRISKLEAGWFAPNLAKLVMSSNPISEFPLGFFEGLGNLVQFDCESCKLGPTLSNGSLEFHSENLETVVLINNNIANIEPGAITGLTPDTVINLEANNITELTEGTFRPMLEILAEGRGFIDVWDNPIMCGCSMAWVVVNPNFLASVLGFCQDGSYLDELDPDVFEKFCMGSKPPMPGEFFTWINHDRS